MVFVVSVNVDFYYSTSKNLGPTSTQFMNVDMVSVESNKILMKYIHSTQRLKWLLIEAGFPFQYVLFVDDWYAPLMVAIHTESDHRVQSGHHEIPTKRRE